jgi:hypothetical protein
MGLISRFSRVTAGAPLHGLFRRISPTPDRHAARRLCMGLFHGILRTPGSRGAERLCPLQASRSITHSAGRAAPLARNRRVSHAAHGRQE